MPFFITFLASLSTLVGSLLIFFKKNKKIIIASLSFASSVMLIISLSDLLPEAFNLIKIDDLYLKIIYILVFLNIGIIMAMFLNKFCYYENELYRVGVVSMIAIILHNIPEGIITFITCSNNLKLGIKLGIAIACHNIPEGITIALPIYYATNSKKRALLYTFISGFSEFFGAIISYLFLAKYINNLGILFAIISGLMIYISLFELLPAAYKYKNNKIIFIFYLIGIVFFIISSSFFK